MDQVEIQIKICGSWTTVSIVNMVHVPRIGEKIRCSGNLCFGDVYYYVIGNVTMVTHDFDEQTISIQVE